MLCQGSPRKLTKLGPGAGYRYNIATLELDNKGFVGTSWKDRDGYEGKINIFVNAQKEGILGGTSEFPW